jgi:protein-disulfide isomerase
MGVPISHFGSAFYLAGAGLGFLAIILRRRNGSIPAATAGVAPIVALMGLGAVAYSVFLAILLIRSGEACPFCIALYVVNVAMLALGLSWWLRGQRRFNLRALLAPGVVAAAVGGGSFAVTTPFLLDALSETEPWTVAGATNPGGKMVPPFSLPARIPSKGEQTAEDGLVEFSDLECPHCGSLHHTIASLFEERGPARLRVRFVNYPLDRECNPHVARSVHPTACLSARGGICAEAQGRFWPFAEATLALQGHRTRQVLLDTAQTVGLDTERFAVCLDAEATAKALAEDIALAHSAGVRATPTVLVNGWTFEGAIPRAKLLKVMDETTPCGCDRRSSDGTCQSVSNP